MKCAGAAVKPALNGRTLLCVHMNSAKVTSSMHISTAHAHLHAGTPPLSAVPPARPTSHRCASTLWTHRSTSATISTALCSASWAPPSASAHSMQPALAARRRSFPLAEVHKSPQAPFQQLRRCFRSTFSMKAEVESCAASASCQGAAPTKSGFLCRRPPAQAQPPVTWS